MQTMRAAENRPLQFPNPPILSLARRLERLYQKDQVLDAYSLQIEISALEDEIAANPATSLQEAAVQVMLTAAFIERIREDLVGDVDELLSKMECLVRSALSAVVRETGVDLSEFGGDRYTPVYTDPFRQKSRCN